MCGTGIEGTKRDGTKFGGIRLLAAAAALTMIAAPASAKLVKLTISGTATSGSDGGNDLLDVTNGPGGYAEVFAPGSIFGTIGDLTGKAIAFSFVYDTASPLLPVGAGGIFDDPIGEWALSLSPTVSIGGVAYEFLHLPPVHLGIAAGATLSITDGAPDTLSGAFSGFTFSGDVILDYVTSNFAFDATLPAGFFSTDAVLPGSLPAPGFGFAGGGAGGTGSFDFLHQTCFLTCSFKEATGVFQLTAITFGAVPEPAAWSLMLTGFALVGTAARRRRGTLVTA